jgi:hypothetical protein
MDTKFNELLEKSLDEAIYAVENGENVDDALSRLEKLYEMDEKIKNEKRATLEVITSSAVNTLGHVVKVVGSLAMLAGVMEAVKADNEGNWISRVALTLLHREK